MKRVILVTLMPLLAWWALSSIASPISIHKCSFLSEYRAIDVLELQPAKLSEEDLCGRVFEFKHYYHQTCDGKPHGHVLWDKSLCPAPSVVGFDDSSQIALVDRKKLHDIVTDDTAIANSPVMFMGAFIGGTQPKSPDGLAPIDTWCYFMEKWKHSDTDDHYANITTLANTKSSTDVAPGKYIAFPTYHDTNNIEKFVITRIIKTSAEAEAYITANPMPPTPGAAFTAYYKDEIRKCISETEYGKGIAAEVVLLNSSLTAEPLSAQDFNKPERSKWVCLYDSELVYPADGVSSKIVVDIGTYSVEHYQFTGKTPAISHLYLWSPTSQNVSDSAGLDKIASCPKKEILTVNPDCKDNYENLPFCDIVTVDELNTVGGATSYQHSSVHLTLPSFTFDKNADRTKQNCQLGRIFVNGTEIVDCSPGSTSNVDDRNLFCQSKCNLKPDRCFYEAIFDIETNRLKSLAQGKAGDYFNIEDKLIKVDFEVNINSDYLAPPSLGNYNTNRITTAVYQTTDNSSSKNHTCTFNSVLKKGLIEVNNVSCKIKVGTSEALNVKNPEEYLKALLDSVPVCSQ